MKIKRFYCSTEGCNKSFRNEEQLILHLHQHSASEEQSEDESYFQCEICLVKFPTKRSVSAHKRVHKLKGRLSYTQKIITLLTRRLMQAPLSEFEMPVGPYTIEDIKLSPINSPVSGTLPLFSSIIQNDD